MSRCLLLVLLGLCATVMDDASGLLYAQGTYPRVMSPTGRFYGPTQAHYQYERQYGHPWHGGPAQFNPNTGVNIHVGGGWGGFPGYGGFYAGNLPYSAYGYYVQRQGFPLLGGYGYGFGAPIYGGYSVYQEPIGPRGPQGMMPLFGPAPTFSWQQPDVLQQPQFQAPQFPAPQGPQAGNGNLPQPGNPAVPAQPPEPILAQPHNFMPPPASTLAQRQRSLHLQGQGDIWFRQQNFLQAYSRYKQAATAAPDQAAPRFRMAYAFMSMQRYELAVPEFQRGLRLDPKYVLTGDSPAEIYGEEHRLAAAALPQAVAAWVRQDIRSADRLFLLGTLLMINGDLVRAKVLLQTALDFGGPAEIIVPMLNSEALPAAPADQPPPGQQDERRPDDRPPVPEAVEEMLKDGRNFLPLVAPKGAQSGPPRGSGLPPGAPPAAPVNPPQPIGPALPDVPAAEPASAAAKPTAAAPGFQPIPKKGKGAAPQPAPAQTTPEPAASDVQPAAGEAAGKSEGPVIPIPGGNN